MTKFADLTPVKTVLIGAAARGRPAQYQKEIDTVLPQGLKDTRFTYDLHDADDEWDSQLEECQTLILTSRGFGGQAVERARNLRFVQKLGRSVERVDVEACRALGIQVSVLPDAGHVAVAEHTLTLLLASARRLTMSHAATLRGDNPLNLVPIVTTQNLRYPNWLDLNQNLFRPLSDLTLGLIGYGEIAREVAWRANALGIKVIYTKRSPPKGNEDEKLGTYVSFQKLLRDADVVSIHATQPDGAPPIMGKAQIDAMKSGATLINTSRGNQVDQEALFSALKSDRLGCAALDVFRTEPVSAADLSGVPNLIVTPHTAANTTFGCRFEGALLNVLRHFNGEKVAGSL